MSSDAGTAGILGAFAHAVDTRDWAGLASLLAPRFTAHFVHTGETFDRAGFVTLNQDYPVEVRFALQDLVVAGPRGVLRARVTETGGEGQWAVASFATVDGGLITDLVEVWADVASGVPPHRV